MGNPFMAAFGGARNDGGFGQMVQAFQQFRSTFRGDPKAEVEKLVSSGKLPQEKLNELMTFARQLRGLM